MKYSIMFLAGLWAGFIIPDRWQVPEGAGKYDHLVIVSEPGQPLRAEFVHLRGKVADKYPHYQQADQQAGYDARFTPAWEAIAVMDCHDTEEHTH